MSEQNHPTPIDPRVKEIIEKVSRGEPVQEALENVLVSRYYVCTVCSSKNSQRVCDKCGSYCVEFDTTVVDKGGDSSFVEFVQTQVLKPRQMEVRLTLGCLRPGDRFIFLSVLPFEDITRNTEYCVSPSKRGYISWTSRYKKVYKCPLPFAFFYPVKILNDDHIDPNRRFYPGDRVKLRETKEKGVVLSIEGDGYTVRVNGEDRWVPSNNLLLINKDKTTKGYISKSADKWLVCFADFKQETNSLYEALDLLYKKNRTAFNRFSKYLRQEDCPIKVDDRCLSILRKYDERLWG